MSAAVTELKGWFAKQTAKDQEEVLKFIYGNVLERRGMYVGPAPGMVMITEGLHQGPPPAASTNKCSGCGRPL